MARDVTTYEPDYTPIQNYQPGQVAVQTFPNAYSGARNQEMDLDELRYQIGQGNMQGIPQLVQAMPQYQGITDAKGNVLNPYKYDPSRSGAFSRMTDISMSQGPTDVYRAQAGVIDQNTNVYGNRLDSDAARTYGTGLSNLAQSGGLDSGARERLQTSSQQNRLNAGSNLYAQSAQDKSQALANDAAMKMKMLGGVADVQNAAQQYNIGNAMGDLSNKNQANMYQWNKLGEIQGSGKIADLMEDTKGTGGYMNQFGGIGGQFGSMFPSQMPRGTNLPTIGRNVDPSNMWR